MAREGTKEGLNCAGSDLSAERAMLGTRLMVENCGCCQAKSLLLESITEPLMLAMASRRDCLDK